MERGRRAKGVPKEGRKEALFGHSWVKIILCQDQDVKIIVPPSEEAGVVIWGEALVPLEGRRCMHNVKDRECQAS